MIKNENKEEKLMKMTSSRPELLDRILSKVGPKTCSDKMPGISDLWKQTNMKFTRDDMFELGSICKGKGIRKR
jgi:hypothetical protein